MHLRKSHRKKKIANLRALLKDCHLTPKSKKRCKSKSSSVKNKKRRSTNKKEKTNKGQVETAPNLPEFDLAGERRDEGTNDGHNSDMDGARKEGNVEDIGLQEQAEKVDEAEKISENDHDDFLRGHCGQNFLKINSFTEPLLSTSSSTAHGSSSDDEDSSPVVKKTKTAKRVVVESDENSLETSQELERNLIDSMKDFEKQAEKMDEAHWTKPKVAETEHYAELEQAVELEQSAELEQAAEMEQVGDKEHAAELDQLVAEKEQAAEAEQVVEKEQAAETEQVAETEQINKTQQTDKIPQGHEAVVEIRNCTKGVDIFKLKNVRIVVSKLKEEVVRKYLKEPSRDRVKNVRKRKKGAKYNFRNSTLNHDNRLYKETLFGSDSDISDIFLSNVSFGNDSSPEIDRDRYLLRNETRHCGERFLQNNSFDESPLSASASTVHGSNSDDEDSSPVVKKRKTAKKVVVESDEELLKMSEELERKLMDVMKPKSRISSDDNKTFNNGALLIKQHAEFLKVPVVLAKKLELSENGDFVIDKNGNRSVAQDLNNESVVVSRKDNRLPDSNDRTSNFVNQVIAPNLNVGKNGRRKLIRYELPNLDDFNDIMDEATVRLVNESCGDIMNDIMNSTDFIDDIAEDVDINQDKTVSTDVGNNGIAGESSKENNFPGANFSYNFYNPKICSYHVVLEIQKDKFIISHFKTFEDGTVETSIVEDIIDPTLKVLPLQKFKKKKPAERRVYYRYIVKEMDDGRRITELQLKTSKFKTKETEDLKKQKKPGKAPTPRNDAGLDDRNENTDDLYFDFDLTDYLIKKGEEELGLIDSASFPYYSFEENFLSVL